MVRSAIKCDFRVSKMALIWNGEKCEKSDFWASKIVVSDHFVKKKSQE